MEQIWETVLLWTSGFVVFSTVAVPTITEFIYEKIKKPTTKFWRSVWSWVIPISLTYVVWGIGRLFDVGFLADVLIWWVPFIFGAAAATISNYSWANIPWIKETIIAILDWLPKRSE